MVPSTPIPGHQLLLPPTNWCPVFASRATQAAEAAALGAVRKQHVDPDGRLIAKVSPADVPHAWRRVLARGALVPAEQAACSTVG